MPASRAASARVIPSSAFAIASARAAALGLGSRRARARSSADDRSDLIDSTILSPNKQQEKRITPPRLRVFTSESDHRRTGIIRAERHRRESTGRDRVQVAGQGRELEELLRAGEPGQDPGRWIGTEARFQVHAGYGRPPLRARDRGIRARPAACLVDDGRGRRYRLVRLPRLGHHADRRGLLRRLGGDAAGVRTSSRNWASKPRVGCSSTISSGSRIWPVEPGRSEQSPLPRIRRRSFHNRAFVSGTSSHFAQTSRDRRCARYDFFSLHLFSGDRHD